MRQETKTRTLYQFNELTEESQQSVIENLHNINVDFQWWGFCMDDCKEIAALMGIDIENIYFSGFWSQGDGACFEGEYNYRKQSVKLIKEYAPLDMELHAIAEGLQKLQKQCVYQLSATVKHSGHYSHERCTDINVFFGDEYANEDKDYPEDLRELLRDFMRWIYSRLESEYEWLTSEESIKETILCNEYEFTENGELA